MVETDMRVTADGVLIANHDADFKRFYGDPRKVTETKWTDARTLASKLDGNHPMLLEDVFRFCAENKMAVMLDNRSPGWTLSSSPGWSPCWTASIFAKQRS